MDNDLIPHGYTRVSEILSIFQSYAHVPKQKLKAAQELGTDIHEAIELYLKGDWMPLDAKRSPYFESFLHWAREKTLKPVLLEKRLFDHDLKITGRIDLLLEANDKTEHGDSTTLIDFKTGSWAHPEIWRLQGTFYRHLIETTYKGDFCDAPNKFLFIQLMRAGTPPIIHEFDYRESDWEVCKAALHCHRYFSDLTLNVGRSYS